MSSDPDRRYIYSEPPDEDGWDRHVIITEREILRTFYPRWVELMVKAGKADLVSEENCIQDFCVVHWATEHHE